MSFHSFRDLQSMDFDAATRAVGSLSVRVNGSSRTTYDHADIEARDTLRRLAMASQSAIYGTHQISVPNRGQLRTATRPYHSVLEDQPGQGDDYEVLLQLDENNVSKGINSRTQAKVLRKVKDVPRDQSTCAICQETMKNTDGNLVQLPCGHYFHQPCVSPWLSRDRTCPTCRKEVHPEADR